MSTREEQSGLLNGAPTPGELPRHSKPWLSVIVPTYNGQKYLSRALESIAAQNDADVEVIAVDDGSTDQTVGLLEQYASRINLKILQRGRIGNWVANTNFGLKQAQGQYLCFLHQDDYWLPDRLTQMKALACRHSDAVMLLHPSYFVDQLGRITGIWNCPFPRRTAEISSDFILRRLIVQNFISIPAPIIKRSALCEIGGLDEELWYTADWKLWLKLAGLGSWIYYPRPLSAFRVHAGSQTAQGSKRSSSLSAQLKAVLKDILPAIECGPEMQRLARFSIHVNQSLAHSYCRGKLPPRRLLYQGFRLGPTGLLQYLRYSRIVERVSARFSLASPSWSARFSSLVQNSSRNI